MSVCPSRYFFKVAPPQLSSIAICDGSSLGKATECKSWSAMSYPQQFRPPLRQQSTSASSPRFEGLNYWVASVVKMLSRVTVWRGVAASHVPACQAEAQVHPGRTDSQAV